MYVRFIVELNMRKCTLIIFFAARFKAQHTAKDYVLLGPQGMLNKFSPYWEHSLWKGSRLLFRGGDRVVVPWYQRGGTWYKIVHLWWNLVPKVGVPVPNLYESVPIKISSMDVFGIPRTNFSFEQCRH